MPSKSPPKAPKIVSSNSDSTTRPTSAKPSSRHSSPSSTPNQTPRIPASSATGASLSVPFLGRGRAAGSSATLSTIGAFDHDATSAGTGLFSSSAPLTRVISDPTTSTHATREDVRGPGSEGSRTPHSTYLTGEFDDFLASPGGEEDEEEERSGGRGFLGASLGRRKDRSGSNSRSASHERKDSSKPSPPQPSSSSKRKPSPLNTSSLPLFEQNRVKGSDTPPHAPPSSWWGRSLAEESDIGSDDDDDRGRSPGSMTEFPFQARGWKRSRDGKGKNVTHEEPKEETNWRRTRDRVAKAVSSVLDSTGVATVHELLEIGSEFAELAPVPGLQTIAKLLLNLWDSFEGVDSNRQACLRLIEHCAEILLSIREEIHEVGEDIVGRELEGPITKLSEAFAQIQTLLSSLARRPFLKRYLKRDDIKSDIELCEKMLNDAVVMFGLGIQVRVLKGVLAGLSLQQAAQTDKVTNRNAQKQLGKPGEEKEVQASPPPVYDNKLPPLVEDAKEDLSASQMSLEPAKDPGARPVEDGSATPKGGAIVPLEVAIPSNTAVPSIPGATSSVPDADTVNPSSLVPLLSSLILSSIRSDNRHLATLLKETLATGRDEEIVKLMQVERDEMLDAIVALRREHERWEERWREREDEIKKEKVEIEKLRLEQQKQDDAPVQGQGGGRPGIRRRLTRRLTDNSGGKKDATLPVAIPSMPPTRRTSSSSTARPPAPKPSPSSKSTAISNTPPTGSSVGSRRESNSSSGREVDHYSTASESWASFEAVKNAERAMRREEEEEDMATLHREFIEGSLDALKRLSRQADDADRRGSRRKKRGKGRSRSTKRAESVRRPERLREMDQQVDGAGVAGLPSWTITRYEINREEKIGIGFFSDVYKGTWRPPYPVTASLHTAAASILSSSSSVPSTSSLMSHRQTLVVAIKVLSHLTPRSLFLREAKIWKSLPPHENVLELYGASSATGNPPWCFVCPYLKEGSLVGYLKRLEGTNSENNSGYLGGTSALGLSFGSGNAKLNPDASADGDWLVNPATFVQPQHSTPGGIVKNVNRSPIYPIKQSGPWNIGSSIPREADLHRFMLEIATGMAHLHHHKVYHGDLKAANVLVDDQLRCVISDFGQSEMKSEAYRLSGAARPHGTLRWQAPELMSGAVQLALTPEMDVYAYSICCVEILSMGRMPWPLAEDNDVRNFVLKDNSRPTLPDNPFNTNELRGLLEQCWNRTPGRRPTFNGIVNDMKIVRKTFRAQVKGRGGVSTNGDETPSQTIAPLPTPERRIDYLNSRVERHRPSPDMRPGEFSQDGSVETPANTGGMFSVNEAVVGSDVRDCSHAIFTPTPYTDSSSSPSTTTTVSSATGQGSYKATSKISKHPPVVSLEDSILRPGRPDSPAPRDDRGIMIRDERRYRLLLNHNFNPSLTLPLWYPTPVELGAVGYLSKTLRTFITLFNAFHPERADEPGTRDLASLRGYGKVPKGSLKTEKRSTAQRGFDAIVGWLTFRSRGHGNVQKVSRRYSYPLRAGKKAAYLCAETTVYRYMESLEVPKKWFTVNVNEILRIYGEKHHIEREDIFLVVGTLDAPDHGLFVSHNHPDGQVHFNVYSNPRVGQPWGMWTTDRDLSPELGGPVYNEPLLEKTQASSNVSTAGDPWNTLILARLRFKPDVVEPTSL